jgi:phospholipid-binding lipoprotein MlaA
MLKGLFHALLAISIILCLTAFALAGETSQAAGEHHEAVEGARAPTEAGEDEAGYMEEREVPAEDEDLEIGFEEEFEEVEEDIADPLEPWNRMMFTFNDKLYFWFLKPVARGYRTVVPEWGRVRVYNFFENLKMPISIVNSLLQFKGKAVANDLARFLANTIFGFGGFFDVVGENPDFKGSGEDLGQTFGVYGLGDGFYIVWPILGPSSIRDSIGRVGDGFLYPVNYVGDFYVVGGIRAYESVNETSLTLGEYEDLKKASIDPYAAARSAYYQYRKDQVKK